MSHEQRLHPRTGLQEETIYFTEERRGYSNERIHYSGMLINISKGGIGLRASHPHGLNELLWFEGLEGISKAQPASVKWIKANGEEDFELGVEFF